MVAALQGTGHWQLAKGHADRWSRESNCRSCDSTQYSTKYRHKCKSPLQISSLLPQLAVKPSLLKTTPLVFIFITFFFLTQPSPKTAASVCVMLSHFWVVFSPPLPWFHISCQVPAQPTLRYHSTAVRKIWAIFLIYAQHLTETQAWCIMNNKK